MLFNSLTYIVFFILVLLSYWLIAKSEKQKILVLFTASLVFYGYWSPKLLLLMLSCITVNYFMALWIYQSKQRNYILLLITLLLNLGLLGYFKYTNFIIDILNDLNIQNLPHYKIILPVGVSFYTFQCLGYVIDVYRKSIKPETNLLYFTTFIIFFPQLVAGPIERASHLLPQFRNQKNITNDIIKNAINLIALGYIKKTLVADSLSPNVNDIFSNYSNFSGGELLLGSFYFSVQIYCDFSGYSDIARGCAKLLGIDLMENFKLPYLSKNITSFWQNWHISLSTWFKDYLFIPLGGSKRSTLRNNINYIIIFAVSGIWHGANYTFLIWGLAHGVLLILHKNLKQYFNWVPSFLGTITTFFLVNCLWIYFRSPNIQVANNFIYKIFTDTSMPGSKRYPLIYLVVLVIFELLLYKNYIVKFPVYIKYIIYLFTLLLITNFLTTTHEQQFIYFDF